MCTCPATSILVLSNRLTYLLNCQGSHITPPPIHTNRFETKEPMHHTMHWLLCPFCVFTKKTHDFLPYINFCQLFIDVLFSLNDIIDKDCTDVYILKIITLINNVVIVFVVDNSKHKQRVNKKPTRILFS